MSDSVPFGKYKGRPVEDMLADQDYMNWLAGQPWFRERFGHLMTAKDREAAERTPVHNRLQAKFLNPSYRMAFAVASGLKAEANAAIGKAQAESITYISKDIRSIKDRTKDGIPDDAYNCVRQRYANDLTELASLEALVVNTREAKREWSTAVSFESMGADVQLTLTGRRFPSDHPSSFFSATAQIEIKPLMGDDYPVVLRQMNRNKSRFLFVDRFEADGVTLEECVSMFHASGKIVVFKSDVDAAMEAPSA